jgi:DNA-binding NtrC family response regulator
LSDFEQLLHRLGPAPIRSRPRVLVVDDHDDHRETLCALLISHGYDCRTTASVSVAEALVETWRPRIVIYESNLHRQDTAGFPERVSAIAIDAKLAIATILVTTDADSAVPALVEDSVLKPFQWPELRGVLERAVLN